MKNSEGKLIGESLVREFENFITELGEDKIKKTKYVNIMLGDYLLKYIMGIRL